MITDTLGLQNDMKKDNTDLAFIISCQTNLYDTAMTTQMFTFNWNDQTGTSGKRLFP